MTVETFDPREHTVEDVNAYLEDADPAEVQRVLAAEETGQARKGILGGPHGALGADGVPALPEGAEVVTSQPTGLWRMLVGPDGEPVLVDGNPVRVG